MISHAASLIVVVRLVRRVMRAWRFSRAVSDRSSAFLIFAHLLVTRSTASITLDAIAIRQHHGRLATVCVLDSWPRDMEEHNYIFIWMYPLSSEDAVQALLAEHSEWVANAWRPVDASHQPVATVVRRAPTESCLDDRR